MSGLNISNETIWNACFTDGTESAWQIVSRTAMFVLGARNCSSLGRVIINAIEDIEVARLALCRQCGAKNDTNNHFDITDHEGFVAGWNSLMAETRTFANIRAIQTSDFPPTVTLAPDVVTRLGSLLVEG